MSVTSKINADLLEWFTYLYPWQHEAFRRLLSKPELSSTDEQEILKQAFIDHGILKPEPATRAPALAPSDLPTDNSIAQRLYLLGMCNLENVNALRPGQKLSTGKQLTVIYGENASGKSGYARVAKGACITKLADAILPDAYATPPPNKPASAVFHIEENGVVRSENWEDGKSSPAALRRFTVFDSKCARVYINSNNQVSFLPRVFEALEALAAVSKEIKDLLIKEAKQLAPDPAVLQLFLDNSTIGKMLATLSVDSDENKIKELAYWTSDDETKLQTGQKELLRLESNSAQSIRNALLAEKKRVELVLSHVRIDENAISKQSIDEIRTELANHEKYDQAAKAAVQLAFGNAELKGIGGPAWQELIMAAAKYSSADAYLGQAFPVTGEGARCVLCQQPLSGDACERLRQFWSFLQGDASQKRDQAKARIVQVSKMLALVPRSTPPEILAIEDPLSNSYPQLFKDTKCYFETATISLSAIEAAIESNCWDSLPTAPLSPVGSWQSAIASIDSQVQAIKDEASLSDLKTTISNEVLELRARKRVSENLQAVLKYLGSLRASALVAAFAGTIKTNGISLKAKDLHKKYISRAYRESVRNELQGFGVSYIKAKIEEWSDVGKVLHRIVLDGATISTAVPESIFSEGEKNAIALACFLADLGSAEETCGIILDDPVSSLDHKIRDRVAARLVAESKKRQVVIFTHDLAFYCELANAAQVQQIDLKHQYIESIGSAVGLVSESEPWDALPVGQRISQLESLAKRADDAAKACQTESYKNEVNIFFNRARSTWERCVEELLFNKVVQRYDKAVKTMSLTGVTVDTEAVTAIFEGMTRTSQFIAAHDHAAAANVPVPTPATVLSELQALRDFQAKQRAKIKEAEKLHKHLKV